jgi:hypothetical protein
MDKVEVELQVLMEEMLMDVDATSASSTAPLLDIHPQPAQPQPSTSSSLKRRKDNSGNNQDVDGQHHEGRLSVQSGLNDLTQKNWIS